MENIIGRESQIEVLNSALESSSSEFVAITGRRRVGKTYLIRNFFEKDLCFYVTGIQNQPTKVQLEVFSQELRFRSKQQTGTPKDWLEAFEMLRAYVSTVKSKRKKVIFFDELPWIDTQRSGFLQIFAHFWNSWAAWENNIILVIAGSSTSWIVNKVYNDKGGLHNRVTKRLWLEPFKLKETEQLFKAKGISLSRYDITQIYMALGGVPFYLNEVKPGESASQCIDRLCFSANGLLFSEFDNLYKAVFNKAESHLAIVKELASHNYGLSRAEIIKKAKLTNSGSTTKVLEELTATGYVSYMIPLGKNSNSGKYVLTDLYSRFYINYIKNKKISSWQQLANSSAYGAWCGITFEVICHLHKQEIQKSLGLAGVNTSTSYLSINDEKGKMLSQIDMLIERADNAINLCEIKFYNDVYELSKTEAENIKKKVATLKSVIKKRKTIFPTMITTFGCSKNMHYLGLITNEIVLDDLFL